jgi:Putative polyhydroxyalkanoic acid system protein (PHA_gran_rgn)
MSLRIEHKHELGIDDARDRIRALGEYLDNKHGIGVTWTGQNEAKVKGKFMVITIDATVTVEEKRVCFDGKDPGMLWRGKAKDYLSRKMGTYLDPKKTLADLPRG